MSCFVEEEFALGVDLMESGNYQQAIPHFNATMVEQSDLFLSALNHRGFCYLSLGDEDWALKDFQTVMNEDPKFNKNTHILAALCCKRSGDYKTAVKYLSRGLLTFSHFPHAIMARAELHLKLQKFDAALFDFKRLLKETNQAHLGAIRGLGDAYRGLGDYESALNCYSKAIDAALKGLEGFRKESDDDDDDDNPRTTKKEKETTAEDAGGPSEDEGGIGISCAPNTLLALRLTDDDADPYDGADHHHEDRDEEVEPPEDRDEVDDEGRRIAKAPDVAAQKKRLGEMLCESYFRRAMLYRLLGHLDDAERDLKTVIDYYEGTPRTWFLFWYAKILLEQERLQEALAHIQCNYDACVQKDEEEGARDMYRSCGDEHGSNVGIMETETLALLSCILMKVTPHSARDFGSALALLRKASENSGAKSIQLTKVIAQAADALRVQEDPKRALALLEKVAPKNRKDGEGNAKTPLEQGRMGPEKRVVEQVRALTQKREHMAKGNDLEVALECTTFLDLTVPEKDECTLAHEIRSCAYFNLKMWDEALQSCRRVEACSSTAPAPDSTEYNKNLLLGILKRDDLEVAVAHFTKAVLLFPKPSARLHRAVSLCRLAYSNLKDVKKAQQMIKDALKDIHTVLGDSSHASEEHVLAAYFLNAICNYCLRDFHSAWESYEIVKNSVGYNFELDALGAEILAVQGRKEECKKLCDKLIAQNKDTLICPFTTRAKCLLDANFDKAIEDLKKAVQLAPTMVDVHLQLADVYFAYGKYKEAEEVYVEAAKTHTHPKLAHYHSLISLKFGKINAAVSLVLESVQLNPGVEKVQLLKDGLVGLQDMLGGRYRKAQAKFTSILGKIDQVKKRDEAKWMMNLGIDRQGEFYPTVFTAYEIFSYRGLCLIFLDSPKKALLDFQTAMEVFHKLYEAADVYKKRLSKNCLPQELRCREEKIKFEGKLRYNMGICLLLSGEYHSAVDMLNELFVLFSDETSGTSKACLWFLIGLCQMATEDAIQSRESFLRSYALDPSFVDDFISNNRAPEDCGHNVEGRFQPLRMTMRQADYVFIGDGKRAKMMKKTTQSQFFKNKNGNANANGATILTMFPNEANRFGYRLPAKKLCMGDVTLYLRLCGQLPFVCPPTVESKVDWSMLSLSAHEQVHTIPEYPWL